VPFLRWSARTAEEVTAISRSTADGVHALVDRPVTIIPYGAAIEDDGGPPSRGAFSGPDARPVRLLFVGRLVERKGVEVLVRALAEGGFGRPVELDVVGAGEWEPQIRAAIEETETGDRVRLLGRVSDEDLRRAYEECDIFVLPAVRDAKGDTEGLGVVLLEAMRFERPVVASAIGGITDIVEDGETGLAVPAGDPRALAAALRRLIDDPGAARDLGHRGRRHAAAAFGWDAVVERTTEVYRRAAAASGGALPRP
jgi:glycosyltransferase involved in cell wall biosynthesis